MRTLNIDISDVDYQKFGLKSEHLSFPEFLDMISRELSRRNLVKTVELAERYHLSGMTMDDISAEVNAVRSNAARS